MTTSALSSSTAAASTSSAAAESAMAGATSAAAAPTVSQRVHETIDRDADVHPLPPGWMAAVGRIFGRAPSPPLSPPPGPAATAAAESARAGAGATFAERFEHIGRGGLAPASAPNGPPLISSYHVGDQIREQLRVVDAHTSASAESAAAAPSAERSRPSRPPTPPSPPSPGPSRAERQRAFREAVARSFGVGEYELDEAVGAANGLAPPPMLRERVVIVEGPPPPLLMFLLRMQEDLRMMQQVAAAMPGSPRLVVVRRSDGYRERLQNMYSNMESRGY